MRNKLVPTSLVTLGVLVILIALTADSLGLGPSPGVGAKQLAMAGVGAIVAAVGMTMLHRRDNGKLVPTSLVTLGVLVFLIALTADSLGLGPSPGLGAKQIVMAGVGVVVAAVGMTMLRRRH